jgi:anti-sigma factor (TIGR02949 family)
MISCSEAVQRLWDYLENDVEAAERDAVEQHLAFCRRCCGEMEFAEQLRGVLAGAAEVGLPADVEARLTGMLDDLDPTDGGVGQPDRHTGGGALPLDGPGGTR